MVWVAAWVSTPTTRSYSSATVRTGNLLSVTGTLRCRPGRFRRQTCNESRPRSDRLLIKPSGRAEPASPPAVDGHINCKASTDHRSTGLRSRVTQESRPQPRRHQLCQPAPGQPARSLTGHSPGRCGWFGRPEPVSDLVGDTGFEPVTSSV